MNRQQIAIGRDDFKEIIEKKSFYVDKTKFIEEIIENHAEVKLFTRPRRFGKSLNMSMLRYFFDIEHKEENRELFNGLYIEKSKYMKYFGENPVILISLKELKSENWEQMILKLKNYIANLYLDFKYLEESLDDIELEKFRRYRTEDVDVVKLETSLSYLTRLLYDYHNKKVVVLIDEYDTPLISSYQYGYYEEAVAFFKNFFGYVLKTNKYLEMGVLTGIVRIAQAGIFSDLNNLDIYTILRKDYEEFFGFTEDEVKESLDKFGMIDKFEEVRHWYDGYKFGDMEIYNPWSIINYLKNDEFKAYWVNTSSNKTILDIIKRSNPKVIKTLEGLLEDKEAMGIITEQVNLTKKLSEYELWEFLLFAGYIKVSKKFSNNAYSFKIPNNEVKSMFKIIFLDIVFDGEVSIQSLNFGLMNRDLEEVKSSIENLLLYATSYWDLSGSVENKYQLLLSEFLYGLEGNFRIYVNREVGDGRADIVLEPIDTKTGYIFELKVKGNKENPIEQIEEKRYDAELKRKGITDIVKIGMIFDGKKVEFVE